MSFAPIALSAINYRDFKNYWLKAFSPGTTNPKIMATDKTGGTTVAKFELDKDGFPKTSGGALIIPYIDGAYDLWLFPTEAEADANDTSNALRFAIDVEATDANELIDRLNPATLAIWQADTSAQLGDVVTIAERSTGNGGGFTGKVIAGGTANTRNIIAHDTLDLSIVIREDKVIFAAQYVDDPTDIGAAWNFADARANTEGWPFILPAGAYGSSISLTWDGIFHSIVGAGIDLTIITFTENVQGVRIRGGYIADFQLAGIGAASTEVGMVIDQNQAHVMRRIRVKGFFDNYEFNGGNSSDFADIFGEDSVRHSWNNTLASPDSNAVTCGMMNFKGAGGTAFNFENGTPSNVAQQWKGGTILVQQSNKGFNISGRGHDLTFYEEFNTVPSTLDSTCGGSQIRVLFGGVQDNGSQNEVITHRQDAAEAISHSNLESKRCVVRDRDFSGNFVLRQDRNNVLQTLEEGSSSASLVEFISALGPALNMTVGGRVHGQVITNTDLSSLLTVNDGNVVTVTNSAPTIITNFVSKPGMVFTMIFLDGNTTIKNSVNVQLAAGSDFSPIINSTLTLVTTGTTFYEVSRSVN